ncbi:MAG: hypothetical protein CMM60_07760 [Rhodospirillaceae bacterium]|nr:hypothetical protein [Rhodospirillaceae bacterium]
MTDNDPRIEAEDRAITDLALACRDITRLAIESEKDGGDFGLFEGPEKLVFLSTMSLAICQILDKQNGCKEIAHIWQELTIALSDVAGGKSAELFRPWKDVGAQPRRISVLREAYFSIAAAVYDLAEAGEKAKVVKEIAKAIKVKPTELKDFRRNLTRGDPQIRSTVALEYYDDVLRGNICVDRTGHFSVDENGRYLRSPGNPSPTADWLKWFDDKSLIEV